jgi:hypothetical protein
MIVRSKTDFATITGRGAFVCHIDTELSPAPKATTEHMLGVVVGPSASRRKIRGLQVYRFISPQ